MLLLLCEGTPRARPEDGIDRDRTADLLRDSLHSSVGSIGSGLPSSFEVDEEADAAVLPQGEALKKLMRKSGRYQKLDDPKGIWGYESYCVDGVVSLDPPPPVARR